MSHSTTASYAINKCVLLACAPFPLAVITTFAFVLMVGERFPRQLIPGSGLWFHGFLLAAAIALLTLMVLRHQMSNRRLVRLTSILCVVTSIMAWPVWTWGVLPSVNGIRLRSIQTTTMTLKRLEETTVSRSRKINQWAYLEPSASDSPLPKARYFLGDARQDALPKTAGEQVQIDHAIGLLGAGVVLRLR